MIRLLGVILIVYLIISPQYLVYDQITFDSLYSGDYILSIVDSFECVLNDTFSLTEPAPYQSYGSTTYPLICESDSGFLQVDSVLGGGNIQFGFSFDSIIGVNTDSILCSFWLVSDLYSRFRFWLYRYCPY